MDHKNCKNLHRISETDVFDWLKVMCDCDELFIEKGISIDHSDQVCESIEKHNKEIDASFIVTLGKNTHAIDLQKTADRHGEDTFFDVKDSSEKKTTIVCS